MSRVTPLGAFGRGLAAGAFGSIIQGLFFSATSKRAPKSPPGVFQPPEEKQEGEIATATVARRIGEGLMKRPISEAAKRRASNAVHVGFGAGWGGLYGLARESYPKLLAGPLAAAGFSTVVWGVSDNLILPAFRLAAWPQAYPMKNHVYALAAHLVYGAGVYGTYEGLLRAPLLATLGQLWLRQRRFKSKLSALRPAAVIRRRIVRRPFVAVRKFAGQLTS